MKAGGEAVLVKSVIDDAGLVKKVPDDRGLLSLISMALREGELGVLSYILRYWLRQKYIFLENPRSGVICQARESFRGGSSNIVLFSDNDGCNKFFLIQNTDLINCLVVDGDVYSPFVDNKNPHFKSAIKSYIAMDEKGRFNNSSFGKEGVFCGFAIGKSRPFHCIYDTYKGLSALEDLNGKNILIERHRRFYFDPSWVAVNYKLVQEKRQGEVYVFPNLIGQYKAYADVSKEAGQLMEKMEKKVLSKNTGNKPKEEGVFIWLGVTGQKRSWLSQVGGYSDFVAFLSRKFCYVKVYIDGLTAPHGSSIDVPEDQDVYNAIIKRLHGVSNIDVESVIGKDYASKIKICSTVDFFVANAGSGSIVPLRICKKPGVLHSNDTIYTFPDNYKGRVEFVDREKVKTFKEAGDAEMLQSYDFDWREIVIAASKLETSNSFVKGLL
ncbi:hypothetical protein BIS09_13550 [Halomonas sp. R1t8]|uniref:hypothetical protein n=1 Tax=unclassified Halomonas TaxID=2609666 RepID=UPI00209FF6E5|nr:MULTISPECIES: hypothetical protein [unclassified Halomonas]MCP1304858.1 hypothetical protein [Halomonas sp. R1t8]MCP1331805.1 hypothetical protein [Halomonas sp. R1t4]